MVFKFIKPSTFQDYKMVASEYTVVKLLIINDKRILKETKGEIFSHRKMTVDSTDS